MATLAGFIEPSDGGKDVFVHISAVERAGLDTRDKKTLTPAPSPLTFDRREKPGGSGGRKKT
jgi:hypothetical protein